MILPGRSISTCKQVLYMFRYFLILVLLVSCGCSIKAPDDYYLLFRGMEAWGQKNRSNTKRTVGDIVEPPENQQPLVVAFAIGQQPAGFLGFIPIGLPEPVEPTEKDTMTLLPVETPPKKAIAIQDDAFRQICKEENIKLVHWRPNNGRLNGTSNVVQIHFVPQAFSDIAIQREFLLLTAIAYGSQLEKNTIDIIRAIAEDDSGSPLMMLEGTISAYQQYFSGNIRLQDWRSQLQIKEY